MAKFKRILLKLSGESLMGEQGYGIDVKRLNEYAVEKGKVQSVLIRVTPGVDSHTHSYISTGQVDSKFGFSP